MDLIYTLLQNYSARQGTIKFIKDYNGQSTNAAEDNQELDQRKMAQGVCLQTFAADYPFIVYNSFQPDNSELIFANLAQRESQSQRLDLGEWQFISFVKTVCLAKIIKEN